MYLLRQENNAYYQSLITRQVRNPELLQYYKNEYRDTLDAHWAYDQQMERDKKSRWETIKNFFFNGKKKSRTALEQYLDQSTTMGDVERRHREWERNLHLGGRHA